MLRNIRLLFRIGDSRITPSKNVASPVSDSNDSWKVVPDGEESRKIDKSAEEAKSDDPEDLAFGVAGGLGGGYVFSVLCDGVEMWRSKRLRHRSDRDHVRVDIRECTELELRVAVYPDILDKHGQPFSPEQALECMLVSNNASPTHPNSNSLTDYNGEADAQDGTRLLPEAVWLCPLLEREVGDLGPFERLLRRANARKEHETTSQDVRRQIE